MARRRMPRSKRGCQACRRRKVRCDETKPVCNACERLDLPCRYSPVLGSSSPETSKYRVRFVNSIYTNQSKPDPAKKSAGLDPSPSAAKSANAQCLLTPAPGEHVEVEQTVNITPLARVDVEQSSRGIISCEQNASSWGLPPQSNSSNGGLPEQQQQQDITAPPHLWAQEDEGTMGMMSMPAFFDLNMNFDSLSEDWMAFPTSPAQRPTHRTTIYRGEESHSPSSEQSAAVSIAADDHGLIQHYLNVMSQYTKLRGSSDENLYTQIFSNMALFYAPLYHAIMAWTAMHLGQSKRQSHLVDEAEQRNSRAVLLLHQDHDMAHHLELALVTIWFALQFELLAARGIDSFCQHLEFAADLIDTHRHQARANGRLPTLSPISSRVLLWLGTYDARVSWIGGTGRFLQSLEMFRSDYDFLDAAFPDEPQVKAASNSDLKVCLRSNLEVDMLDKRIALLHRRAKTAPAAIWSQVQSDLWSVQHRLETASPTAAALDAITKKGSRAIEGKITTKLFNNLLSLSACYSLAIEFHRLIPASVVGNLERSKLISGAAAADRIVRISAWVNRLRPPSPQNTWPRILFLAGIETTDLVHQDWVLRMFSESERWGDNFTKTRALLDYIIKEQGREGDRVDYLDAMKRFTGLFII